MTPRGAIRDVHHLARTFEQYAKDKKELCLETEALSVAGHSPEEKSSSNPENCALTASALETTAFPCLREAQDEPLDTSNHDPKLKERQGDICFTF